ncbi:undecaprenol kinase [Scopulibacillus darangshiensis]|uniref:Undecaprenol kinase n=1 Tax=Scopulibacillus darangshiensis TaxID=442528 RepID=A0A4R2PB64_9BACL|nr:diacylglycerol kinase family protein [Scopulibacillus darangshiensis]TCP32349.1 undecaprenol kinase [Scopulibacillus darangshiensis]
MSFIRRVGYALSGIRSAFRHERNLQIQAVIGLCVIIIAIMIHVSLTHFMIILILVAGVISLELINTAIERAVDLISTELHPLARAAKDIAAGAVLWFSIFSAIIGFMIIFTTLQ